MIDSSGPGRRRVLVTRPAGQADDLIAAVEAIGCTVYSQPLLKLQALPRLSPRQRQCVVDLDLYQHIIFISGNAVRFGMDCIEDYWPQLPVGVNYYAVGEGTAGQLRDNGVEAITPGALMNSEGLLELPELQAVESQRVLIVKGEGGRGTLVEELTRRGARVDELACYLRSCPELSPGELGARLVRWRIDLAMISSGEGFANMQALLSPQETTKFTHMSLIAPSERVSRMAREAGYDRVVTAENASNAAMLRALEEWISRENNE